MGVTAPTSESATTGKTEVAGSSAFESVKTTMHLQIGRYQEAADAGEIAEGSVWEVTIIEAGKSLNGVTYPANVLQESASLFEGTPVYLYTFEDPEEDADHLPGGVTAADGRGFVGNQVGLLESVHWDEGTQSLRGLLKLYDASVREKFLEANALGDLGDGSKRNAFGLSIDALGDQTADKVCTKLTHANSVDVVSTPAAGGRIRRLVASLQASDSPEQNQEDEGGTVESFKESVTRRITERQSVVFKEQGAGTKLEEDAWLSVIMDEGNRRLSDIRWNDDLTPRDKATQIATIATELSEALAANASSGDVTESFKEGIGTFAAKLKLMADELSAADDSAGKEMLEAILKEVQDAIADANKPAPDTDPEEEESEEDTMADTQNGTQSAGTSEAGSQEAAAKRMSEGLTTLLASDKVKSDPKLREALVEVLGEEPNETDADRENRALREQIRDQAIRFEFSRIQESGEGGIKFVEGASDLVFDLIDKTKVNVSAKNEVKGLREAVEAVLEAKPFLRFVEAAVPEGDAGDEGSEGAPPPATPAAKTGDHQQESAPKRTGVRMKESYTDDGSDPLCGMSKAKALTTYRKLGKKIRMGDYKSVVQREALGKALGLLE